MIKDSASFRDPSGFVFSREGKVYRWVSPAYLPQYRHLMASGLYQELVNRRLLIPHKEVTLEGFDARGGIVIQPKRIPFISYPYEWCFAQYQDAALATMDIQNTALKYGMVLKDASAYNIQFLTGYAVLIDTLSFDFYRDGSPWGAYGQYCRHFLAPLILMSSTDARLSRLMQSFIDGVPLDLASALLKGRGGMTARIHIHTHARFVARHQDDGKKGLGRRGTMRKEALSAFCQSLRGAAANLRPPRKATEWGDYYAGTNYTQAAADSKAGLVRSMLSDVEPLKNVWDFGANDGRYSRIANELGANVVAFDFDENAVAHNWQSVKASRAKMLPLILDLSAPSPAIGFANRERKTIGERQRPDCIMLLAVLHHMAISNNLPFGHIARWLSELSEHLIIEFVPKDDSQVQLLLATRDDIFPDYHAEAFESAFSEYFTLVRKAPVEGSQRMMYLWKRAPL